MEKDLCFICDGPELPAQKLVKVTPKGYPYLLIAYICRSYWKFYSFRAFEKSWHALRLRYQKRDLYNKSVKITLKSTRNVKNMFGLLTTFNVELGTAEADKHSVQI